MSSSQNATQSSPRARLRILPGDRVHAASLAGRFLVFQLLVVAVVLGAVAAISVAQSTREFRDVRGQRMIAVAENVASTPIVRDRYADPLAARTLAPEVDRAVALSGADLVEITDPTGVVRVSSQPDRIGQRIELDASRADEGRSWFGDTDIDGQHSLVGRVPDPGAFGRTTGHRLGEPAVPVGVGTAQRLR